MKKIILAFDGVNFSGGAIEFAKRLSFIEPILLTGVFLPQTQLAHLWNYASVTVDVPPPENDESGIIQKNIERFESLCQKMALNIVYITIISILQFPN